MLAVIGVALLIPAAAWAQAPSVPSAPGLRWEVEAAAASAAGRVSTRARFVIEAGAGQSLPAMGWALYFSCIGEVEDGSAEPPFIVEPVVGTLYRIRPTSAFAGLAAGESVSVRLRHPGVMQLTDRAPQGPYFVFDADADRGVAPAGYRVDVAERFEQLVAGTGSQQPGPTAQALFHSYERVQAMPHQPLPPIFPMPLQYQRQAGVVAWRSMPRTDAPPALRDQAASAQRMLAPFVAAGSGDAGGAVLRLRLGPVKGQPSPEAYALSIVAGRGVTVTGASAAGVSRGLASLRSLLPAQPQPQRGLELPAMRVVDAPRFAYRGLMLDVARHFHGKDTLLRVIEMMAALKLNVLHLHLTDDEGWRVAISGLPELTEFGAHRGHSADPWRHLPPAHGSGPDAQRSTGSGHYSADDYIEILRAADRHGIELIPELEMPGHARAAVKAMALRWRRLSAGGDPQASRFLLSDPEDRSAYRSAQGYGDNVMNPALPSTYAFVEHVVDELAALHRRAGVPLRQLHVGADELPSGAWSQSPAVQAMIRERRLAGLPGLWTHFYDQVITMLQRRGIRAAGWEELGSQRAHADGTGRWVPNPHFIGRDVTLTVWNNLDDADDLAYRLANAGYRVVLSPVTALYFDMAHSASPGEPGVNWATTTALDAVFNYRPLNALQPLGEPPAARAGKQPLSLTGRRHIAGLQANLFSEVMPTRERMERLLLPRLFAMAERAWAAQPAWETHKDPGHAAELNRKDRSRFMHQLGTQLLPAWQRDWPDVQWHIPAPGLLREGGVVRVNRAWPGLTVRYTLDGNEPTAHSPVADNEISNAAAVRAAAFDSRGQRSLTSRVD
jgi:hexosaminidase